MVTSDDYYRLVGVAWRLDRLRWVPRDVLGDIVMRDGLCVNEVYVTRSSEGTNCTPPPLTGIDAEDREFAARLCAQCPVQDECLELELRMAGEETTGVWGALNEQDRRDLYPHWRQRGERVEPLDGGE